MDRAGRDRSVPGGTTPAGTLDSHGRAPGGGRGAPGGTPAPAGAPGLPRRTLSAARRSLRASAAQPAVRQLALLACYLAAGVAVTWPRATYLGSALPSSRDSASYVWGFWWMARQVAHLHNPWLTHYMAAPYGVQLGFHTLMPLPGLLLTPITLAFGSPAGPVLSYNLMVAVVPGLLCYTAYRAARLWLRSAPGAIAAGAFFGLSSMLTQQDWYHLNIALGAMFLPMALEASVRLRRRPGRRQAVILGLVMGAAVLTDQESAVLAAIVTGLALVPWLVRRPAWAKVWPAAGAVAVGTFIATPQIVAMVQEIVAAHGGLSISPQLLAVSYKKYGIGLPGMFSPTPRVADFGLGPLAAPFLHGRDNEGMPMFGTVLTVLALGGIVAAWRRRGTWLLAALWAACAALALGTSLWIGKHQYLPLASSWNGVRVSDLMPYTWFVRIPGLSSFREADRLAILGLLPAALLAGAAVDWMRFHARPLIVVVAALGTLEAGYTGNQAVGTIYPAQYAKVDARIAHQNTGSVVVDLPFGLRGGIPVNGLPFMPQALVVATADGHPRAISYTSRVPLSTINAVNSNPFYANLIGVQHEQPAICPWLLHPAAHPGCSPRTRNAHTVTVPPAPADAIDVTPGQMIAARREAHALHIGWVVMWRRNPSMDSYVRWYLLRTGFRFAYRVKVDNVNVLVYRAR